VGSGGVAPRSTPCNFTFITNAKSPRQSYLAIRLVQESSFGAPGKKRPHVRIFLFCLCGSGVKQPVLINDQNELSG
jgi:hypothetical protein